MDNRGQLEARAFIGLSISWFSADDGTRIREFNLERRGASTIAIASTWFPRSSIRRHAAAEQRRKTRVAHSLKNSLRDGCGVGMKSTVRAHS